jgi:hypothetical protein
VSSEEAAEEMSTGDDDEQTRSPTPESAGSTRRRFSFRLRSQRPRSGR